MELRPANRTIALLCFGLQLLLGALPLSGVVLCVAPGHIALEAAARDCAGPGASADQSVAPQCTDYGVAQSDAIPPDLRLPQPKPSAPLLSVSLPSPGDAILRSQLRVGAEPMSTRTPSLRSLRTVILLV
jgi:hypothetical protein